MANLAKITGISIIALSALNGAYRGLSWDEHLYESRKIRAQQTERPGELREFEEISQARKTTTGYIARYTIFGGFGALIWAAGGFLAARFAFPREFPDIFEGNPPSGETDSDESPRTSGEYPIGLR